MRNIILGLVAVGVIVVVIDLTSVPLARYSFLIWMVAISFLVILFKYFQTRTDKFVNGYEGEADIDRELKDLDKSFVYISQGLETGKGNIDKIVVGPTGIWALEVKSHSGNITFDGQTLLKDQKPLEKNFLGQAYSEARTLQERIKSDLDLSVPVQPVLVFSSKFAKVRLGLKEYKGVYVIQKAGLVKLLTETHYSNLDINTIKTIEDYLMKK